MKVLALDLGTKTGWALYNDGVVFSGTWTLATPKEIKQMRADELDRCCDLRFKRLTEYLQKHLPVDYIYFEDVQFLTTQLQAQLWAGLRTAVVLLYPQMKIKAVPVGTLKKFATGNGAAKKEQMAAFLQSKTGLSPDGRDDNEIDALHLLWLARNNLKL